MKYFIKDVLERYLTESDLHTHKVHNKGFRFLYSQKNAFDFSYLSKEDRKLLATEVNGRVVKCIPNSVLINKAKIEAVEEIVDWLRSDEAYRVIAASIDEFDPWCELTVETAADAIENKWKPKTY